MLADRYRLVKQLGRGGVGEVWLASDTALERSVAIKLLSREAHYSDGYSRFAREARVLARLVHPSIVTILDVGSDADLPYVVMQYVEGPSLSTALRSRNNGDAALAVQIGLQTAEALLYAHTNGVLHRDVKPSNILLEARSGRVLLSDFGIASMFEHDDRITAPGAFIGTPAYASPESLSGDQVGPAADVYSLGVCLIEVALGRYPFPSSASVVHHYQRAVNRDTVERALNKTGLPKPLTDLLRIMVDPDPERRPDDRTLVAKLSTLGSQTAPFSIDWLRNLRTDAAEPETRSQSTATGAATSLLDSGMPPGFATVFRQRAFSADDTQRFNRIQETLTFYRDHLREEYTTLLRQAKITFTLWLTMVSLGFLILAASLVLLLLGRVKEGASVAIVSALTYFMQRIFNRREDHYRTLAAAKHEHLEYGNQWLLVIQSIEAIENDTERARKQSRLVEVMAKKLGTGSARPVKPNIAAKS